MQASDTMQPSETLTHPKTDMQPQQVAPIPTDVRINLMGALGLATVLALCSAVVRVAVLRVLPARPLTYDMSAWLYLAQVMKAGANPYNATAIPVWPPFWMQILFILSHISAYSGIPLLRVIQAFLILVEAILTAITYLLLSRHWPVRRAFLIVLIGLVLNPVAITLTTVHGNFDLLVGLFVLLFVWGITSYHRSGRQEDWLLACLFLGLGILAKTTPLILLPLLIMDIRQLSLRSVLTGAFLVAGPVTLGLSIIFMLGGHQVLERVLSYQSFGGYFGITGLFNLFHWPFPSWVGYQPVGTPKYSAAFGLVILAAACALIYLGNARKRLLQESHLVLIAGAFLVAVPTLGPGYATQYAWWFIAVVVLAFALGTGPVRIVCLALYVVASATYIVEYGLVPSFGEVLLQWPHPAWFQQVAQGYTVATFDTIARLPIFAAYLAFLFIATWTVARQASRRAATQASG